MNTKTSITHPTNSVLTVDEVTQSLSLPSGFKQSTLEMEIDAATRYVEKYLERSLLTRTITLTLDHWPNNTDRVIYLPYPPFVAISGFTYVDTDGEDQDLEEDTDFTFEKQGDNGRLVVAAGSSWPSVSTERKNGITVTYTAGYGATAADLPKNLKRLVLALVEIQFSKGELSMELFKMLAEPERHYCDMHQND